MTSISQTVVHAPVVPGVVSTYSRFWSGCKRCTQQVGSKATFYGSMGKLINSSFIL